MSGQRIPPHTPVDLVNGDTLRLGASKREYRLLWLSLREALEMEDAPYMPPLAEDKEEPHPNQVVATSDFSSVLMEKLCCYFCTSCVQSLCSKRLMKCTGGQQPVGAF